MAKKNYLYIKTTKDEYELPIAVSDNIFEFSKMVNVKVNTIRTMLCHTEQKIKNGIKVNTSYHRIEIDDEDDAA